MHPETGYEGEVVVLQAVLWRKQIEVNRNKGPLEKQHN
jgi:hypothetical protein